MQNSIFKYFYSFRVIRSKSDSVCQLFVLDEKYNTYNWLPRTLENILMIPKEFVFYSWDYKGTKFARTDWNAPQEKYKFLDNNYFAFKPWRMDLIIFELHPYTFSLDLFIAPGKAEQQKEMSRDFSRGKFNDQFAEIRLKAKSIKNL